VLPAQLGQARTGQLSNREMANKAGKEARLFVSGPTSSLTTLPWPLLGPRPKLCRMPTSKLRPVLGLFTFRL
jgi:hypothetical protein